MIFTWVPPTSTASTVLRDFGFADALLAGPRFADRFFTNACLCCADGFDETL
jgi:hypothetical protein